jgi:tartrate-resistant acid phosphatase type 5
MAGLMPYFRCFVVFVSLPILQANIEFVALGDWGFAGESFTTTINSMRLQCPDRDFVLLLGDKYPRGFESTSDSDWSLFTEGIALETNVPHHVVLGNHDYMSNPEAQIDYSKLDSRWDLPSKYYKRTHSDGSVNICLIGIDTNIFDQSQADWLQEQLSSPDCNSDKAWIVVMGHHPIWSGAMYKNTTNLVDILLPVLKQNMVHLYLSGHDHVHQIFYDGQLTSVVTGAVSVMRAPVTFAANQYQIWGVSGYNIEGYAKLDASETEMNIQIIAARTDRVFQQFSLTRNGTRESIFGHIIWSRADSNKDAIIAEAGTQKSSTKNFFSAGDTVLILVAVVMLLV